MPNYKVNNETYTIPDNEVELFESDFPDAQLHYQTSDGEKYTIYAKERKDFLADFPDATELGWKSETFEQEPADKMPKFDPEKAGTPPVPMFDDKPNAIPLPQQEKEYNTTLAEGFKQEARNLGAGVQALAGESLNLLSGTSLDDQSALGLLNEAEKAGMSVADYTKTRRMDMLRSMGKTPMDEGGRWSKEEAELLEQDAKILKVYEDALKAANGNVNQAKKILEEQAQDLTRGDVMIGKAAETLSQAKENKSWAWFGGLLPQMAGNASAIALGYLTKGRSAGLSSALMGTSRALGLGSMAGLTASTAGMSMVEAREKGASTKDVWAVGMANAAIEWLTEKIPFDTYTKKIYGAVKSKLSKGVSEVLSSQAGREELERLLVKANQELGGKLFSGKNLSDYIKSIAEEAGGEAIAEALQTITPMIYLNPEEYPELSDVIGAAWEGAKGGLVMGAMLGGASKATEHALNKDRRKSQGYVDVAVMQTEGNEPEVVEVLSVDDENGIATVLQGGEAVEVKKDAIEGDRYRFTYADFENARLTELEDEAIDNETVTEGQAKAAGDRVAITATELDKALAGLSEEQKQAILNDAERDVDAVVPEDANEAYQAHREALRREREVKETLSLQQEKAKLAIRDELTEKVGGQFWREQTDAAGDNPLSLVETGMLTDGTQVYIVSEVNEAGEALGVTEDGRKMVVKNDMLQDGTQIMTLTEFIDQRYAENKGVAEQTRMLAETERRNAEVMSEAIMGSRINLGTEEAPRYGTVNTAPNADGVIVLLDDGGAVSVSMDELANILGKGSILTDAELASAESAEILGAEAALKTERAQNPQQVSSATDEAVVSQKTAEEAMRLPLKADGSVDQTTLWNQDPERWAQWNDEQRQDGGANSLAYINGAISREQAKLAEIVSAYDAEPDFDARSAMEPEIAAAQERLNRLAALQQNYAPPVAQQDQAGISTEKVEEVKAEPKPRERSVESEVARLYDLGLSDEEVVANLEAKVTKAQKALDAQSKKAPKMGADENAYITKKREHQQKMQELQQELDFATAASNAVNETLAQQSQVPEAPGTVAIEKDPEPQNAVEFAARELGLKDGGIKLQRQSFSEHTGYGPSEMKKFFGLFKSKQDGGLTIEQAGERLMELDRENNTGFFDQNDPNAGLNAVLDALGAVNTIGELRSYVARQRQAEAQKEADAAYSAMMADYEAAHGMSAEEVAAYDAVMNAEAIQKGLNETEYNELNSIFAEEISEYDTRTEESFGQSDGEVPSDVERGGEAVPEGSDNVLQSPQSDYTAAEGTAPEGEQSTQDADDVQSQDGNPQVQPAAVESSLDEDMPDFTNSASAYFPSEKMKQKFSTMRARINDWAQKLGVQVRIMEALDDVVNQSAREQILKGGKVYGYFDPATGEVSFYLPDFLSLKGRELTEEEFLSEIDKTYIHEVVSHRGLRGLLGEEKYGELCDMVWDAMTEQQKATFLNYPGVNGNSRIAADEFIAHFAEHVDYNDNRTLWDKIVDFIKDLLTFDNRIEISNEGLAEILRHSYARLARNAKAATNANANQQAEGNTVFRAANGALVGMHNISEDKLRKVIKQGGSANPSTAVIDIERQSFGSYGEISFIMPSSLVDAGTGRNAGTFIADAWTPTYPQVSKRFSDDKLQRAYWRDISAIPEEMSHEVRMAFDSWLDNRNASGLAYMFLHERGEAPEMVRVEAKFPQEIKDKVSAILGEGRTGLYDLSAEEKQAMLELYIQENFGGNREEFDKSIADRIQRIEDRLSTGKVPSFVEKRITLDLQWMKEHAYDYDELSKFVSAITADIRHAGEVNDAATTNRALDYIKDNGLEKEFDKWKESLNDRYGIKEYLFDGYTPSGNQRWLPNTVENASKLMNKQGLAGATGMAASFNRFVATLAPKKKTLSDIRASKDRLVEDEKRVDDFREKWSEVFFDLGVKCQPDAKSYEDYGLARLTEAAQKKNPGAYLKKEYGVELSQEDLQKLSGMIKAIKTEFPARYFETKFQRPVYLNEFAAAVMPTTASEDIKQAVSEAGLPIFEYDSAVEGSRKEATLKATEGEGIRFRTTSDINSQFNAELQQQIDGTLPSGHIYQLGMPSRILRSTGIPDLPITLQSSILNIKSNDALHSYDLSEVKDLVKAIQKPWAIFKYGDSQKAQNLIVGIAKGDKQFLIGISLNPTVKGKTLNINSVRNVFPKDNDEWLNWIQEGKLLRVDEKEKIQAIIDALRINPVDYTHLDLDSIANIVENFENPSIEGDIRFRMSNENQAIFVSNAARAVEGIKQEKATPEQWMKMIEKNGGLKAGEDKWMGLSDWLKASDKKTLTKAEVLDFINENMIVIEEEKYGEVGLSALQEEFNEIYDNIIDNVGNEDESDLQLWEVVMNPMERAWEELRDRYSGGDDFDMAFSYDSNGNIEINDPDVAGYFLGVKPINDTRLDYTTSGLQNKQEIALVIPAIESWNERDEVHFGDAGDGRAVAWIRFGETKKLLGTTEVDGKKKFNWARVLVIDEIQSKRHQEGREKGYRVTNIDKWLKDNNVEVIETGEFFEFIKNGEPDRRFSKGLMNYDIEKAKRLYVSGYNKSDIPDAPFDKNWHELAMKRMLRYAAENGYDVVAWTKGDQQAERYNIGDVVTSVDYRLNDDGTYHVDTMGSNGYQMEEVPTTFSSEAELAEIFGKEIARKIAGNLESDKKAIAEADKEIGKLREWFSKNVKTDESDLDSIFESAINNPEQSERWTELEVKKEEARRGHSLSETDFRIGGEGMKGFYDKMLPAFMNKYGKKWGVKVEDIHFPGLENGLTMHSVPVTEEMKASVMEGQVMFRMRGENESAEEFYNSVVDEYKSKYVELGFIETYPINEETAKRFGYTLEELKETGGLYESDTNISAIFVHDDAEDSMDVEACIFHEQIHFLVEAFPYMKELGKWMRENANTSFLTRLKEKVEKEYTEEWHDEEMLTYAVSLTMAAGGVTQLEQMVPQKYHTNIRQIEKEIGYDRAAEESSRRAGQNLPGTENGTPSRQSAEKEIRRASKKELTAEERRVINDYFPGTFAEPIEQARQEVDQNPTDAQKEAGNYRKGHLRLDGYNITIENPKGSVRRGTDSKGNAWENTLNNDYGYIRGTEGVDGDHIDVYLSDNPTEGNVFVIDQVNPETREFDEHKVMYGFNSAEEARDAYLANFSEGWNGLGTITEVSKDEFKKWIESSHRKTKPFSEYKSVKTIGAQSEGEDMKDDFLPSTGTPTDEVVTNGLRLTPSQTATLAGNIFSALPEESRERITDGLGSIADLQDAILQIPTSLATKDSWSDEDRAVAEVVAEQMTKMAGDMTRPFSAEEGLWLLYNNLNRATDLVSEASRALVRRNLGFDDETLAQQEQAKEDVRFRSVSNANNETTAKLYNKGAVNVWTRLKESFVDMNASVDELVKAMVKLSGKEPKGFEDIRLALNQQSSKGLAAMEGYELKFLNPMLDAISDIIRKTKKSYDQIVRYVILKHGLERNDSFAKRDAREYYGEMFKKVADRMKNQSHAQRVVNLSEAKKALAAVEAKMVNAKGDKLERLKEEREAAMFEVTVAELVLRGNEKQNESDLKARMDAIDAGTDAKYQELRNKDYSGITSMFYDQLDVDRNKYDTEEEYQAALMEAKQDKYATLADVEAAAQAEVDAFEKDVNTAKLWKRINAATKETLRQQYEANMISKEQYETLRDIFQFYVPLRGFADNTAEDMYTYYRKPNSTGYTKPILGAEGRKTEAESPFGWIAAMANSAIASNVKNEAKLALFYFVSNRPDNGIATISKTWFEFSHTDPVTGKKVYKPAYPPFTEGLSSDQARADFEQWQEDMKAKRAAGQAYESGQRLNLGNAVVNISDRNRPEHIVNVKVAGKDYTIIINGNPRAAQAINGDLNIEATAGDYSKVFGPILRWMSSVNTSYNPEFWITNMQRDVLFTLMNVTASQSPAYRKKFFSNYAKAFKVISMAGKNERGTLGNSYIEKMYQEFVENGGVTGYTQIKDNEVWEKDIENYMKSANMEDKKMGRILSGTKDALHVFHRFGESLEQVSRFAAFLTSREMGKSINEAINDAKEITVNFNRKGSGKMISWEETKKLTGKDGKPLNDFERLLVWGISSMAPLGRRFIMFFNASIQGLNAMYKLYKNNPSKMTAWSLGYLSLGVMQALLHAMMDDDDDYLDIPQYERRTSLMLGANGTYLKWALPQEARAFYALGDLAVESIMGRNPHQNVIAEALKIGADIAPVNPTEGWKAFLPSVAVPFVELMINEDWKGDPIYNEQKWLTSEERKRTAKAAGAYQGTGKRYIWISEALNNISGGDDYDAGLINIQPEKMEHLVQSAFGGTIRTADKFFNTIMAAIDPEEEWTVKQTPFLNRLLTINDERFRNVHINEVYDYYKAEAEHAKTLQKKYTKDRDMDAYRDLMNSDEMQWSRIYERYKKPIMNLQEKIKVAEGTAERRELMKQQDELKRRMIKEISELSR